MFDFLFCFCFCVSLIFILLNYSFFHYSLSILFLQQMIVQKQFKCCANGSFEKNFFILCDGKKKKSNNKDIDTSKSMNRKVLWASNEIFSWNSTAKEWIPLCTKGWMNRIKSQLVLNCLLCPSLNQMTIFFFIFLLLWFEFAKEFVAIIKFN